MLMFYYALSWSCWLLKRKKVSPRFYLVVDAVLWHLVMLNLYRAKTNLFGKSCISKGGCPWCTTKSNFEKSCFKNCCSRYGSTCCPCSSAEGVFFSFSSGIVFSSGVIVGTTFCCWNFIASWGNIQIFFLILKAVVL